MMGTERGQEDERPPHRVFVDGFELGVFPVTRAEYRVLHRRDGARAASRLVASSVRAIGSPGRRRQLARCDGVLRVAVRRGRAPGPVAD